MKNAIEGQKIAEEIIDIIQKGKVDIDCEDYRAINHCMLHNSRYDQLKKNLTNQETYRPIQSDKKGNINKLFREVERKKRVKQLNRRLLYAFTSIASVVVVLVCIIYFDFGSSSGDDRAEKILTAKNETCQKPTLILSSGLAIDLIAADTISTSDEIKNKILNSDTIKEVNSLPVAEYNTILIPAKYTYILSLDDGTMVTLNANSTLKYPIAFNGETREVFLSGEAYFDVTKSSRPFIVHAPDMSIKVYGTTFNVNTNLVNATETVLISGSVGVTLHNSERKEIMIKPNQCFSLNLTNGAISVETVNVENYISWKSGLFVCEKKAFNEVLHEISLWYGVEFECRNNRINEIVINSLHLKKSLEIKSIITALEAISGAKFFQQEENKYVIE